MSRIQKKCLIVSLGIHLTLVVLLIVGPAFLPSEPKADNSPVLTFIPVVTTDDHVSGGGSPTAPPPARALETPPPQPQAAPPQPQPRQQPRPVEPVKPAEPEPRRIERPSPEAFEPVKKPKHTIEVNDKLVTSTSSDIKAERARQLARERAAARRRATEFNHALASLKGDFAPSTSIELQGPGGGGVPYGNFLEAVRKAYTDPWIVPPGVSQDAAATVSVTIARDGTVISARIIKSSGNDAVDGSVQSVLDRVKFAAPLPEGSKEDQRTVDIVFDVKSKLIG